MKKVLSFIFAIVISSVAMAQDAKFEKLEHDFGKIKFGTPVYYDFAFENVGKKPIIIESAMANCGCTTPVKPEKPIMPGAKDAIKAGYNSATMGVFTKSIYVKIAGVAEPVELKIKGEVVSK